MNCQLRRKHRLSPYAPKSQFATNLTEFAAIVDGLVERTKKWADYKRVLKSMAMTYMNDGDKIYLWISQCT